MSDRKADVYAVHQLLWRKLPAELQLVGPFPLLYGNIDDTELPTPDPGNKPWGRLVVQNVTARATNIRQTQWRVEGRSVLQIFCRRSVTNSLGICQKAAQFCEQNINPLSRKSDVVFSDVRGEDMPAEGGYSNVNFTSEFWWYERRKR